MRADSEGLTDLCPEHLRQSIRHVQRNCDIDCTDHEDATSWDACKQPDRYSGDRMARALATIPKLLAAVEAVAALADQEEAQALSYRESADRFIHGEVRSRYLDRADNHQERAARIRAALTTALGGE